MDINQIIQSAGTMAFPCMFCIYCFKVMIDYIKEKDTQHQDEIEKLSTVIHQNTETLIALKSYLENTHKE